MDATVADRVIQSSAVEPFHTHADQSPARGALRLGFWLTLALLLVEVAAGIAAHSLALLSDAAHICTDVVALGLAWFAAAQAARPANSRRTYGYHRVGILTALINGSALVIVAFVIAFEAWRRLTQPQPVQPGIMVAAAALAIGVNLFLSRRLHAGDASLNTRAALLHVTGDIGASAAVIVGALAIALTNAYWLDPALSLLIAALIVFGSLRLIRETLNILLEATPHGVDTAALARDLCTVPGIHGVHDLHVWTITSGVRALSCHAVIDDLPPSESARILDRLSELLRERYGIAHSTVQFESTAHEGHDGFCACPPDADPALYCDLHPALDAQAHAHTH